VYPFQFFRSDKGNKNLVGKIDKMVAAGQSPLPPFVSAPADGYWVLPVGDLPTSSWARASQITNPLEFWGPKYFAIRTPMDTFPASTVHRITECVKPLLSGDGVSHNALKPWMQNDHARSKFDARHIGIVSHYGKDSVGSNGLRLSKDTVQQGGLQMDAVHRFFEAVQRDVAPIIGYLLQQIDPTVYQFQQAYVIRNV
jgi:hypothetical protein